MPSASTVGIGSGWHDGRPGGFDGRLEVGKHPLQDRVRIHRLARSGLGADAREHQQIIDELLHPGRAIDGVVDELVRVGVEFALVAPARAVAYSC